MAQLLFDAVCDCNQCPAPSQVERSPDQPPEPWLGEPSSPVWALGLDPAPLKAADTASTLVRRTYTTGKELPLGYAQYRSLCEANPKGDETLAQNLYRLLPTRLGEQLFFTNLVRCRRAPGRRELTKATMRNCFGQHLLPLLNKFSPKLLIVYGRQVQHFLQAEWRLPATMTRTEDQPTTHFIDEHQAVVFIENPSARRLSDPEAAAHRAFIADLCQQLDL